MPSSLLVLPICCSIRKARIIRWQLPNFYYPPLWTQWPLLCSGPVRHLGVRRGFFIGAFGWLHLVVIAKPQAASCSFDCSSSVALSWGCVAQSVHG